MSIHLAMIWLKSCSEPYRRASRFLTIFSLRRGLLIVLFSRGIELAVEADEAGSDELPAGVK